jgi:hypothetical protein
MLFALMYNFTFKHDVPSQGGEVVFVILEILLLFGSGLEWLVRLLFVNVLSTSELLVLCVSLFLRHSAFGALALLALLQGSTTTTATSGAAV